MNVHLWEKDLENNLVLWLICGRNLYVSYPRFRAL